jgi:hypothetical protein
MRAPKGIPACENKSGYTPSNQKFAEINCKKSFFAKKNKK